MEKWIESAVGKVHVDKIAQGELAKRLGIRRDYLSKILNGSISPKNAKERISTALNEIISDRKCKNSVSH